ncbi:MAG: sulfotransferase [Candidatus Aminicenantes bacterium]|nr:sulfotransferase [Candidatus Aminicenantes bacterium]
MRKIPNLFIVGAARSGTTSLWRYLKSHPGVFMPGDQLEKEPAFFSGLKRSRFKKPEQYLKLFENAREEHVRVGEASTAYLTDADSARRIYEYNPQAKIIIMLRNPARRAYSLYNWMVQEGYEYAKSFETALELEKIRINKKIPNYFEPEYYYNYLYFNSGLYYEQVKRYLDLFKERVLTIKFEDYIKDFSNEWRKICAFLEIEPLDMKRIKGNDNFANESRRVRSAVVQFVLRKATKFYLKDNEADIHDKQSRKKKLALKEEIFNWLQKELDVLSKEKIVGLKDKLILNRLFKKIVDKMSAGELILNKNTKHERDFLVGMGRVDKAPPKMRGKTYRYLQEMYRPGVADLSQCAGVDFSDWLSREI